MTIEIIDKIENFTIADYLGLEAIVNVRLWARRDTYAEALAEYLPDENGEINSETFMEHYTENYRALDSIFYVKVGDKVIAGGALQHWSFDRVKLVDFVVTEEHSGRGVGAFLLDHIIEYCKNKGKVEINLEVRVGMPAVELYLKKGFEIVQTKEDFDLESDLEDELEERGIEVPSHDCYAMELYL